MSTQMRAIVDKLLTNVSNGYFPQGVIAEQVLPAIPSKQYTGLLGKYGTNHLRIEKTQTGGKSPYRQVNPISRSSSTFSIDSHGLSDIVTKRDYANVELPFDAEKDTVTGLTSLLLLQKEFLLGSTLSDPAIITQNVTLAGVQQYNDYNNSSPLTDFETARAAVKAGCGLPPDTAILTWEVENILKYHPDLLDFLGYKFNRTGGLSKDELASALGVKRVLISETSYESAAEGAASVLLPVWGKNIIFGVFPEKASTYQVAVGYEVRIDNSAPRKVYKESLFDPPESTKVLVEDEYVQVIANANAAYLIGAAVA